MNISSTGIDFLTKEEGVVLHAYKDSVGVPTIGIGTTVYPDGRKVSINDPAITIIQAKSFLQYHVDNRVIPYIATYVKVPINQTQIDVLCSFIYNIGGEGFKSSTLLKKINSGASCDEIKAQFMRWNKAGGKPILTGRRLRESNLYC